LIINNYYSARGRIGRHDQSIYNNLNDWRLTTSDDDHSLSVNPFFPPDDGNQVDLSMNQVLLKNAGTPVDDIHTDIADNIRDVLKPDVGAKETDLCTYDAGINAILSPGTFAQSIPGGQELRVLFQNHGTASLSSTDVIIHIMGAGVDTMYRYAWDYPTGLPGGSSTELVFDETFDFHNGLYTVKAWTESPNGHTDCNLYNDTTEISVVASLCGVAYTIGGPDADFSNFSDAIAVLNIAGITCPVVFNVRDGVYEERVVIGNISGTDTENKVIFIAENGSDAKVVVQPGTGEQAAVIFRDAHNIEFRHIEFVGQHAVIVADQSSNINIEDCSFLTQRTAIELEATGSDNINIINNSFSGIGASRSDNYIVIRGNEELFAENVLIKNNLFVKPLYQALHITASRNITIEENHFEDIQTGIFASNTNNLIINGNWFGIVSSPDRSNAGASIEGGNDVLIYNNFIRSVGPHPAFGIRLLDTESASVFFNTINIKNSDSESKGIWLQQGTAVSVKNNILFAPEAYPIYIDMLPQSLVIDHNNYYNAKGLIGFNGISISNFNDWKSAIGGDSNSSDLDPRFASDDYPLPYEQFLNGAGETIQLITHDIYGKERFEPPDIGCMEFFIDYGVVGLVAPIQQCSFTAEEEFSVVVERFGDVPLETIDISVRINNGDEFTETIAGDFEGVYTHTFSDTFDLSEHKAYEITIRLSNVSDDNQNNDHDSYLLVHPEPVNVDFAIVHETCAGRDDGSVSLDVSGGIAPYTIRLNGIEQDTLLFDDFLFNIENLAPGTYEIVIVDKIACEIQESVEIYTAEPLAPVIYATNETGIINSDSIFETLPFEVEFSFTVNDEDLLDSWLWRVGTITATSSSPFIYSFEEEGTHEVILEVNSGEPNDCVEQASFTINIEIPLLSVDVELQPQFCANDDPSKIELNISGGLPPFTVIINEDTLTNSMRSRHLSDLAPGSYTVKVVDRFGQSQTFDYEMPEPLSMNPAIFATDEYGVIHTDTIYGVIPFDISFSFKADEIPASNIWYYDDQTFDNSLVIPMTVNEQGITTIFLEVHSGKPYDCIEVAEYTIVAQQKVVIIPVEVFTPNGGGPNKYFEVISKGLVSLEVDIYDRRGLRVNGFTGLDGRWNGDYDNGNEAPDGMYPFYLRGMGFDDHNYEQAGLIRLIREATNLFPNPASQFVHLDIGRMINGPFNVEIINYKGERILYDTMTAVNKLVTLDVSGLLEGVYLVRLSDGNRIISKKLIIARP
jgi:hypothetical protein